MVATVYQHPPGVGRFFSAPPNRPNQASGQSLAAMPLPPRRTEKPLPRPFPAGFSHSAPGVKSHSRIPSCRPGRPPNPPVGLQHDHGARFRQHVLHDSVLLAGDLSACFMSIPPSGPRINTAHGFELHFGRGIAQMGARASPAFAVMMAMALARVAAGHEARMPWSSRCRRRTPDRFPPTPRTPSGSPQACRGLPSPEPPDRPESGPNRPKTAKIRPETLPERHDPACCDGWT